jgi:hypothetical protein
MTFFDVNYIAVGVSAVVAFVIGMLWYSPLLFANAWMKLSGRSNGDLNKAKKKGMAGTMLAGFASILVMSYVLAYFVGLAGASTVLEGAQVGFLLWLGFIATVMLGIVLWENKPVKLYVLNIAHYFVVMLMMGAILAVWV